MISQYSSLDKIQLRYPSIKRTIRILLVKPFLPCDEYLTSSRNFSARVAYTKVEKQFKLRAIPYTHVNPHSGLLVTPELAHIQSSLARSVPSLCVQSSDILSGAPAAEAAMPNIRVIPLNWWSERKAQVGFFAHS